MTNSLEEPLLSDCNFYRGSSLLDDAYDEWVEVNLTILNWQALIDKQYRFTKAEIEQITRDMGGYFEDRDGEQHDLLFQNFEVGYESSKEAYRAAFDDIFSAGYDIQRQFDYVELFASRLNRQELFNKFKEEVPGKHLDLHHFHKMIGTIGFFLRNKLSYEKVEEKLHEIENKWPNKNREVKAYIEFQTAELKRFDKLRILETKTREEELKKTALSSEGKTLIDYLNNLLEMFNELESDLRRILSKDDYFNNADWLDEKVIKFANECVLLKRIVYEMYEYGKLHNFVDTNVDAIQLGLFE